MKYVFKGFLLSLLLLTAWPLIAHAESIPQPQVQDLSYPFSTPVRTDNFTIIYNQEKVSNIPDLAEKVMIAYGDTERFFGDYLTKSYISKGYLANSYVFRTTVEVAGDNNEFRLLAHNGNIPDDTKALNWNEGINGLIVIKSPAMLPDFRQVLSYQIARIAERTIMTNYRSAPEWYLDGMATYVAGDVTQDQRSAAVLMAVKGSWMSPGEMEAAYRNMTLNNIDEPYYSDARAQAAVLIDFIGHKYGNRTLVAILKDYSDNGNLNQAFVNCTEGYSPEAINAELMDALTGNVAQAGSETGKISGFLNYRDGKPASGLMLSFTRAGTTTNVKTDTAGHFSKDLVPGTYKITVSGLDLSDSDTVTITAGKTMQRNVTLAFQLPVNEEPPTPISIEDMALPGLAVAINIIALIAILAILRRNWH